MTAPFQAFGDLREGDIGFGPLAGGWGKLGMWGEVIVDGGFHVGDLEVGHVFVVTRSGALPQIVEAMPNGAREVPIGHERWTSRYAYVRIPEDYPGQRLDAAAIARAMIGTPYSPLSYLALAAWRLDMLKGTAAEPSKLEAWIDRRHDPEPIFTTPVRATGYQDRFMVALPMEAICSVLADQSWALAGKQVMPKDTPHQCVTPSGLGAALLTMPGAQWAWPA